MEPIKIPLANGGRVIFDHVGGEGKEGLYRVAVYTPSGRDFLRHAGQNYDLLWALTKAFNLSLPDDRCRQIAHYAREVKLHE